MFNENPTAQITALFLTLLFVFLTACLIVNHVTWYNETDVIKCIKACGDLLYSGADNKLVSLPLREQCAERCMNLEDAKAPRVYKAECVYRVVNSNWYNPYYSESLYWGNYSLNLTNNSYYYINYTKPGRVYVKDEGFLQK